MLIKMKNKFKVMSHVAAVSLICLTFVSCYKVPKDVTSEIQDANQLFMTAVSNADAKALTAMYTADAKLLPANSEVVEGPVAIGGFWNATMGMGIKKVMFETVSANQVGDMAIEEGKYALYVEGDHMVDQGKYMVTWKKEEGKWKVYRDIWNTNAPEVQTRAAKNDTVMMVIHYVKPDKVGQFEDFNKNYLFPAGAEVNPKAESTIRMQKPVKQNGDGTYTYIYFMDPFVSTYDYDMASNLTKKFGAEKATEYMKMFSDCVKEGKSQVILSVETGL